MDHHQNWRIKRFSIFLASHPSSFLLEPFFREIIAGSNIVWSSCDGIGPEIVIGRVAAMQNSIASCCCALFESVATSVTNC